ncbi:MAG: T9SS type A sorting domain-containing protein [Flavobacteriaceae bacterium]|nr:T9SS type A sorting domain-containing protein [Flavobacteriaceae bacterium]
MNLRLFIATVLTLSLIQVEAQNIERASSVAYGQFVRKTMPLRDFPTVTPQEYRINEITIVENNLRANEKVNQQAYPQDGVDPLRQRDFGGIARMPIEENFDGLNNNEGGGFTPPDPSGAAGPNHYLNAVNVAIKIFDKQGNTLAGPTMLGTFLGSPSNSGDPIILYDHLADRYFVSEFGTGNSFLVGVSDSPDPTGAYNVYQFNLDAFPDYPHYSVWHDGYYVTANKFSGNTTYVMDRAAMIAGDPNPAIVGFNLPGVVNNNNTVFSPEPANLTGVDFPPGAPGYIVYLQDDGWGGGIANDHLKVWEITMDWNNPSNSSISQPFEIPTDPFDSVFAPFGTGDVAQPGTSQKIDMIGGIISYAANYRSFGGHNSWVITFNVDVDGNDTSGIRWVELRNSGIGPWSLYQEGTYAPADGHSRFMGSAAMDAAGNIGMGFNIASATLPAGIKYTGRYDGDPLGQMTVAEASIVEGIGVQTFSNRFGDYSHLTMDPDNFTFWHTAEYFTANNAWRSRVAAFTLSSGFNADIGVSNISQPENGLLTANETVEVAIRNFGLSAQSNFPVELYLDGNLVATETFTGTINSNEALPFTFAQTVDLSNAGQTYTLEAKTNLTGDEFAANDEYIKEVRHLLASDVGATEITAPTSGSGLGLETLTVTLENFGALTQSNFDVTYTVNGGTPVTETFIGSLDAEQSTNFSFAQQLDLTALGPYEITVSTALSGDQEPNNDSVTTTITNLLCQPNLNCSFGDGFQLFAVNEINNPSGCEGYGDFTNQVANFDQDTAYDLTVTTGYGDQFVTVWIDFNDDFNFTADEKVVNNYVVAPGQAGGSYTETMTLTIPAGADPGTHLMRAKTNWQAEVPENACEETTYGETEDYSANIGGLSGDDYVFSAADLLVRESGNDQFDIELRTQYQGPVYFALYNVLGQQLKFKTLSQSGPDSYQIKLDMVQAASGVYIVKLSGPELKTYQSAKLIVR